MKVWRKRLTNEECVLVLQAPNSWRRMLGGKFGANLRYDSCATILERSWYCVQLPAFYNEILNHPNTPDDVRRDTESKLLRHYRRYLHALPATGEFNSLKAEVSAELQNLVNGAVILRIPDELAWMIFIEGKDCDTIGRFIISNQCHCIETDDSLTVQTDTILTRYASS